MIELGTLLAGPFAGRLLGDLGAEIIKVEPPGQPDPIREWGRRATRAARSGGRSCRATRSVSRSTCARSAGRSSCSSSSRDADVLIENFRPGTLERWNLGFERLQEVNPGLILARVSGYGQTGPYAKRAGFASVGEAMGGLRYINGFPGEAPPRVGMSLGDSLAGMFAVQGILAALYERDAPAAARARSSTSDPRVLLRDARGHRARVRPPRDRARAAAARASRASRRRTSSARATAVGGDRGQRGQCLPPALRGDGAAGARRRRAIRDPPRARRSPGGARGHHRGVGGPPRRGGDRPHAQRGRRRLRADLHDRRHLRGPALPGPRDAARARRPRVRPVHRAGDHARSCPRRRARCAGRRRGTRASQREVYGELLGLYDDELDPPKEEGVI